MIRFLHCVSGGVGSEKSSPGQMLEGITLTAVPPRGQDVLGIFAQSITCEVIFTGTRAEQYKFTVMKIHSVNTFWSLPDVFAASVKEM